jgi:voltage-gated potassium channel
MSPRRLQKHHRFMVSYSLLLLRGLRKPVFTYLTTLSFTTILVCSAGIFFFESAQNPEINSLFNALYYSVTVMTGVGLGDLAPVTVAGKVLSMAMMLLGTAIFVCFTASLASILVDLERKKSDLLD